MVFHEQHLVFVDIGQIRQGTKTVQSNVRVMEAAVGVGAVPARGWGSRSEVGGHPLQRFEDPHLASQRESQLGTIGEVEENFANVEDGNTGQLHGVGLTAVQNAKECGQEVVVGERGSAVVGGVATEHGVRLLHVPGRSAQHHFECRYIHPDLVVKGGQLKALGEDENGTLT